MIEFTDHELRVIRSALVMYRSATPDPVEAEMTAIYKITEELRRRIEISKADS